MKIGNTIIETGIDVIDAIKERETVRGIFIKENKVYMLYSKLYNDYTFPGGGVKKDEDKFEALKRELFEEIGATKITIKEHIGFTEEIRYGINNNNSLYKQVSNYYLCELHEQTEPSYVGREKLQGLEARWVNVDDVIKHNDYVNKNDREDQKGYQTVLIRENQVLKHIKEFFINEKI